MIVLGIILIIVGAALGYFLPGDPQTNNLVRFAAAILIIAGLVLVVLGLLDEGDVNLEEGALLMRR